MWTLCKAKVDHELIFKKKDTHEENCIQQNIKKQQKVKIKVAKDENYELLLKVTI